MLQVKIQTTIIEIETMSAFKMTKIIWPRRQCCVHCTLASIFKKVAPLNNVEGQPKYFETITYVFMQTS